MIFIAKKITLRRCVATKESYQKKQLIRIVKTPEKQVIVDESGRANGRGAYIKKSKEALEIAIKKKAISRALDIDIPQEIYDQLYSLMKDE